MGLTCNIELSPLSNLMGLTYWVSITISIFLMCTRFTWDEKKYAFFRVQLMFIPQSFLFYYIYFWLGLNSFSAWLVWFCDDWDAAPVTLIFYIVKIMLISFIGPAFMLTTKIWIPIVVSIFAMTCSIASCIMFGIKNDWAGICGIVDIISILILLIIFFDIVFFKQNIFNTWNDIKDKNEFATSASMNQTTEDDDQSPEKETSPFSDPKDKMIGLKRKTGMIFNNF